MKGGFTQRELDAMARESKAREAGRSLTGCPCPCEACSRGWQHGCPECAHIDTRHDATMAALHPSPPAGRALTPEQKRDAVKRLLAAWQAKPDLRLGEPLVVACERMDPPLPLFAVEDADLVIVSTLDGEAVGRVEEIGEQVALRRWCGSRFGVLAHLWPTAILRLAPEDERAAAARAPLAT